jgi:hypothetical protein
LFDARNALGGLPPPDLSSVGIEAERDPEIGERGRQVAFAFIGLGAVAVSVQVLRNEKLWGGRRRSWHLHRPYELMEVAPWPKSMISAET